MGNQTPRSNDPTLTAHPIDTQDDCQQFEQYFITNTASTHFQNGYAFRMQNRHPQLVDLLYAAPVNNVFGCAQRNKFKVVTERIPYRLNFLPELTPFNALIILRCSLRGFRDIFRHHGLLNVKDSMIGINQNNQVKIWLNSNFAVNTPEENPISLRNLQKQFHEREMVNKIIGLINSKTVQSSPWTDFISQQQAAPGGSFDETLLLLDRWTASNNIILEKQVVNPFNKASYIGVEQKVGKREETGEQQRVYHQIVGQPQNKYSFRKEEDAIRNSAIRQIPHYVNSQFPLINSRTFVNNPNVRPNSFITHYRASIFNYQSPRRPTITLQSYNKQHTNNIHSRPVAMNYNINHNVNQYRANFKPLTPPKQNPTYHIPSLISPITNPVSFKSPNRHITSVNNPTIPQNIFQKSNRISSSQHTTQSYYPKESSSSTKQPVQKNQFKARPISYNPPASTSLPKQVKHVGFTHNKPQTNLVIAQSDVSRTQMIAGPTDQRSLSRQKQLLNSSLNSPVKVLSKMKQETTGSKTIQNRLGLQQLPFADSAPIIHTTQDKEKKVGFELPEKISDVSVQKQPNQQQKIVQEGENKGLVKKEEGKIDEKQMVSQDQQIKMKVQAVGVSAQKALGVKLPIEQGESRQVISVRYANSVDKVQKNTKNELNNEVSHNDIYKSLDDLPPVELDPNINPIFFISQREGASPVETNQSGSTSKKETLLGLESHRMRKQDIEGVLSETEEVNSNKEEFNPKTEDRVIEQSSNNLIVGQTTNVGAKQSNGEIIESGQRQVVKGVVLRRGREQKHLSENGSRQNRWISYKQMRKLLNDSLN